MYHLHRTQRLIRFLERIPKKSCRLYSDEGRLTNVKNSIKQGPGLKDFIAGTTTPIPLDIPDIPYLPNSVDILTPRKVFFDVYGCQMNLNDTEIVWSILKNNGFEKTENEAEADIFLVMTCAIREGAESKIWHRLDHLRGFKRRRAKGEKPVKIGILGCMAERLKEKLIDKEKSVDVVAGPDSYRDLPRLLALTDSGQKAVNVLLSLDETYADVVPVRLNQNSVTAFISIMRGCDNMCSYCIVPFTRGRERSRPVASIVDEVRHLSSQGVKEVTLLGQNVNSYRDTSERVHSATSVAKGFRTVYKPKQGGLRFADLLERVSSVDPEMRIRFTAAHPKDFPDEVLQIIASRANICKLLHLPAQAAADATLERMRRGYTVDAYRQLVQRAREVVPGVGFSTDMICGFCGETDDEFELTIDLLKEVRYHAAFLFPYSMREKTTAFHRYKDDVPDQVKKERHKRMVEVYTKICQELNEAEIGNTHLVLIEGRSKKTGQLVGRNEMYLRVLINQTELTTDGGKRLIGPGDYVAVKIESARSSVLNGVPLCFSSIRDFYSERSWGDRAVNV